MDTERVGPQPADAAAEAHVERGYPQFDCVGCYVWIWERLIQTAGGTEFGGRHIRRNPPHNTF